MTVAHTTSPSPSTGRLLDALPAVYRRADREQGGGELQHLLGAFESLLLGQPDAAASPGYEQRIAALPSLLGAQVRATAGAYVFEDATRDLFMPWIAARWVAFAPFRHFDADRLRRIVAGIVPLYARRGTPGYLLALLRLCFDEVTDATLHERLSGGLVVGAAELGRSTLLGSTRDFWFRLDVHVGHAPHGWSASARHAFESALRAVVEFAKPAHTSCQLFINAPSGRWTRVVAADGAASP